MAYYNKNVHGVNIRFITKGEWDCFNVIIAPPEILNNLKNINIADANNDELQRTELYITPGFTKASYEFEIRSIIPEPEEKNLMDLTLKKNLK